MDNENHNISQGHSNINNSHSTLDSVNTDDAPPLLRQQDSNLQQNVLQSSNSLNPTQNQLQINDVPVQVFPSPNEIPFSDGEDAISAGSDSQGPEPSTVHGKTFRKLDQFGNPIDNIDPIKHSVYDSDDEDFGSSLSGSLISQHAPRGELDDVPDDYELNIDGFRVTAIRRDVDPASQDGEIPSSVISSSVLRSPERQYIKLEVISARQIKGVLTFFNICLVLSIIYSIVFFVLVNTKFKTSGKALLPETFLSDDQKKGPENTDFGAPNDTGENLFQRSSKDSITSRFYSLSTNQYRIHHHDNLVHKISSKGTSKPNINVRQQADEQKKQQAALLVEITTATLPKKYVKFVYVYTAILSIFFAFIAILFFIRLMKAGKRNITHEQIWTLLLIIVTSVYFNFPDCVYKLHLLFDVNRRTANPPKWFINLAETTLHFRNMAMTTFWFFYLWASLHAYRILEPTAKLGFRTFYFPKLLVAISYLIFVAIANFYLKIVVSEVPVLSGPAFTFVYGEYRIWDYLRVEWLYAIAISIIELIFVTILIFEARATFRKLEQAPYMKHRTKRVGFRFFLFLNFVFYFVFIFLHAIIVFGTPKGEFIFSLSLDIPRADADWPFTAAPHLLIVGYVLCTAYVHLPCTSVGIIKGWFTATRRAQSTTTWSFKDNSEPHTIDGEIPAESIEAQSIAAEKDLMKLEQTTNSGKGLFSGRDKNNKRQYTGPWPSIDDRFSSQDEDSELLQSIEPITYRKRESKDSLELKVNCFTMQTHVIMFNFAWYVYYYGTPKLNRFDRNKHPLPFDYRIAASIRSEDTDTQVLIVDCTDRIIVTFKGTTSLRNLRTSIRVDHERLQGVLRTSITGEDESNRLKKLFGNRYTRGKIHKGFAEAYLSISDEVMEHVNTLREEKSRPVFLTGHSLGGALATICSLDMWVKLDIKRREIFVSTFGSPRVGNVEFARLYDEVIPLHWRIVVDPDMIAKLPNVGYSHVGKKVVLTPLGEMIIDPSALERRPWSGEAAVFAYHRKASYMLAMRAWCLQNHAYTYTPTFWPFPIRREDERRFADALNISEELNGSSKKGKNQARKIVMMDALVDALGDDAAINNLAVVERWARLSNRILLHDNLSKRIGPGRMKITEDDEDGTQ